MAKGFLTGFGVAILLLAALLVYRSYNVSCPCGFKYDPFTGGCVVDLNAGPCGNNGGGNPSGTPGNNSGTGPGSGGALQPNFPASCTLSVGNCTVRPDWKAAEFTYFDGGGTVSTTPVKLEATLAISQRDKDHKSCAAIKGAIDVAVNSPTTIPFDAAALAGSFPIATTSASGPPSNGLVASFNDPCRGTETQMVVFPTRNPECGCKVAFKRD